VITEIPRDEHGIAHIVMFSGGLGSFAAAQRIVDKHGAAAVLLLFANTLIEDEDLYRFMEEGAEYLGAQLLILKEGRDPWQVFFDVKFLGNPRIDPCSKVLKRQFLRKWIEARCEASAAVIYLGIDWTEEHRFIAAQKYWMPWVVEAPLCTPPLILKDDILHMLKAAGIAPPRLYEMGFPHNNCGGFCIKAGQTHFRLLLEKMPERYAYHEQREQELRKYLGKDVAILVDRSGGGPRRPLTLRDFRKRIEAGEQEELFDWGGCGCFSPA